MHSSPEPALARIVVTTPELYGKGKPSQQVDCGVWKASPSPSDSDAASWATITLAPKAFGAGELSTLRSAATEHGRFETVEPRILRSALCVSTILHSAF